MKNEKKAEELAMLTLSADRKKRLTERLAAVLATGDAMPEKKAPQRVVYSITPDALSKDTVEKSHEVRDGYYIAPPLGGDRQ